MADERDTMLRALAQHRGLKLVKSRRRKPGGDFGRYGLSDAKTGKPRFGFDEGGLTATAEDIETYLRSQTTADWKSSLAVAGDPPPSRRPRTTAKRAKPAAGAARRTSKPVLRSVEAAESQRSEPEAPAPAKAKPALKIREAKRGDADAIADLIALTGDAVEASDLPGKIATLARRGTPVLVAEEGRVIGCASWQSFTTLNHAAPVARVTMLVVAEKERRRGIGTALLAEVERKAKAGCGTVELVNAIELSNANGFLRGHGYERSGYRFSRRLDSNTP